MVRHFGTDVRSGLSSLEASVRQGLVAPNELEQGEEVSSVPIADFTPVTPL